MISDMDTAQWNGLIVLCFKGSGKILSKYTALLSGPAQENTQVIGTATKWKEKALIKH